ncbi:MAG: hypothetical protein V1913_04700 [Fibrobacterota bacterium]
MTTKIALLGGTLCLLLLACNGRDLALFNPDTYYPAERADNGVRPLTNDTPDNVLENLKISYNTRNYDLYQAILAPDYRFYMSQYYLGAFNDGVTPPPDPASWTPELTTDSLGAQHITYYKTALQDLATIRKMFDPAGNAKELELFYQASRAYSKDPDTVVYNIRNIELTVILRNNPTEPYVVSDKVGFSITQVWLIRGSDALWRIWRWYDNTYGAGDSN